MSHAPVQTAMAALRDLLHVYQAAREKPPLPSALPSGRHAPFARQRLLASPSTSADKPAGQIELSIQTLVHASALACY